VVFNSQDEYLAWLDEEKAKKEAAKKPAPKKTTTKK